MRAACTLLWCVCGAVDYEMAGFHGKPLCFCGSDLQTGSQFLHVQDNIRGLVCTTLYIQYTTDVLKMCVRVIIKLHITA